MTALDVIVVLLARVVQGEGAHLVSTTPEVRDRVATGIAWVVKNRVQSWDYPSSYERVIYEGFYGVGNVQSPAPWAEEIARNVLYDRVPDPTNGCLFVLSRQDLEKLGVTSTGAEWSVINGEYELHFFKAWPDVH